MRGCHASPLLLIFPVRSGLPFFPICPCIFQLETDCLAKNEMVRYGFKLPFEV